MTQVKRWRVLADFLKRGQRYKFVCNDGSTFEATYDNIIGGEDVDVLVLDVRDLSKQPRFDGIDRLYIGVSELTMVEPV